MLGFRKFGSRKNEKSEKKMERNKKQKGKGDLLFGDHTIFQVKKKATKTPKIDMKTVTDDSSSLR
jgi:hypothetical protein